MSSNQTWGGAWLDLIERADSGFAAADLDRGRSYAQHDWRFDVDIEPGHASALARSGPRLTYRAEAAAPVLDDAAWERLFGLIAESSGRTAALFDRELDIGLLDEAADAGVRLFPEPSELRITCECRSDVSPCKHTAAVLYVLADAFDEDPFDLLLFRGREAAAVISGVGMVRAERAGEAVTERADGSVPGSSDTVATPAGADTTGPEVRPRPNSVPALSAWQRKPTAPPSPLPAPTNVPDPVDFGSDPPRSAPFTARGLNALASDAAVRAFDTVTSGAPSHLSLSRTVDLARRAAAAENTAAWSGVVSASPFSGQAMRQRAQAWRLAGAEGVIVLDHAVETTKVSGDLQFRRSANGSWFRFEKVSGRWTMTDGPVSEPRRTDAEPHEGAR